MAIKSPFHWTTTNEFRQISNNHHFSLSSSTYSHQRSSEQTELLIRKNTRTACQIGSYLWNAKLQQSANHHIRWCRRDNGNHQKQIHHTQHHGNKEWISHNIQIGEHHRGQTSHTQSGGLILQLCCDLPLNEEIVEHHTAIGPEGVEQEEVDKEGETSVKSVFFQHGWHNANHHWFSSSSFLFNGVL